MSVRVAMKRSLDEVEVSQEEYLPVGAQDEVSVITHPSSSMRANQEAEEQDEEPKQPVSEIDKLLSKIEPILCDNPQGVGRCQCGSKRSRCWAVVSSDNEVKRTFCCGSQAIRVLGLGKLDFYSKRGKQGECDGGTLYSFSGRIQGLPGGQRTRKKTPVVKKPATNRSPKREPGVESSPRPPKKPKRINPQCTSGRSNCYCHSGRARAVFHVDQQGNILGEHCSASDAARKHMLNLSALVRHMQGHFPNVGGKIFRYKLDGVLYKQQAKPVELYDPDTGLTIKEYNSARHAGNDLGLSNSSIGRCCYGDLPDVNGYYFRFQDASLLQAREFSREQMGRPLGELQSREMSDEEKAVAEEKGITVGETELIMTSGTGNQTSLGRIMSVKKLSDKLWCEVQFQNQSLGMYEYSQVEKDIVRPVPMPDPVPAPPANTPAKYRFDELNRVIWVDVSATPFVFPADEDYIRRIMDRPDVTLVIRGLATELTPHLWSEAYIRERCGNLMLHKLRCFQKSSESDEYRETEWKSMKLGDYFSYLQERADAYQSSQPDSPPVVSASRMQAQEADSPTSVSEGPVKVVENHEGAKIRIPVLTEGIYMIDFDLPKHLPELLIDLEHKFKLDFLPRGGSCLLRHVPLKGHPFMGPNLYVTPPGTFTHFHQDGHGTVDSGHQCLRGRNEVIMLRRMDEPNKRRALHELCGNVLNYDALYGKPHDAGAKPPWPTDEQIERCRKLGYCPSVFVLEPGDYVHINKGRIHAFRKKPPQPGSSEPEEFCVSVAWDWLYQGSESSAVKEEMAEPLSCAKFNHEKKVPSLAHVETAIAQSSLAAQAEVSVRGGDLQCMMKESRDVLQGLDSLMGVFRTHQAELIEKATKALEPAAQSGEPETVTTADTPIVTGVDAMTQPVMAFREGLDLVEFDGMPMQPRMHPPTGLLPVTFFRDPDPDADMPFVDNPAVCDTYVCGVCQRELSDAYLQCQGCQTLLNKSTSVCVDCFANNQRPRTYFGHSALTNLMHFVPAAARESAACHCHRVPCEVCKTCPACRCKCHAKYELRYRYKYSESPISKRKKKSKK